jgi:flavin reductase (DIM6/NTAB) family NADH-FMN oxidoreductase RutF
MKHELNAQPACFKEVWPRQLEIFSWMDYVTAIPQAMMVITTWKEGQIPNACLQAWATYVGDAGGYYVISSISNNNHTYKNIFRDKDFVVDFPKMDEFPKCYKTIENNSDETDEITTSGLTIEPSQVVNAPRIKECFLNLECQLRWHRPLHEGSVCHVIAGEVVHVAIESSYVQSGTYRRYGSGGFTFNIPPSKNPETGKQDDLMVGIIEPVQKIE